jgi:hypothetical protein
MKKNLIAWSLIMATLSVFGQEETPNWARMRYELKVNALSFSFAEINMQAEFPASAHTSVNFFAGYLFSDNNTTQSEAFGNWGFAGLTYRFYAKNHHHGFYFGPYLKHQTTISRQNILVFNPVLNEAVRERSTSYLYDNYLGAEIGYKGFLTDTYFFELFFGLGRVIWHGNSAGIQSEGPKPMELTNLRGGIVFSRRSIKGGRR